MGSLPRRGEEPPIFIGGTILFFLSFRAKRGNPVNRCVGAVAPTIFLFTGLPRRPCGHPRNDIGFGITTVTAFPSDDSSLEL